MKREIAEELARIACVGHDNRFTRWVGTIGQSPPPSSRPSSRRRHRPSNRPKTSSAASSRQSVSSSSGDPILPLHLNVPSDVVRKRYMGRRSTSPAAFVPSVHHQREVSHTTLIRKMWGSVSAYYEPGLGQWKWITEPRKVLSSERLEGDTRYFGSWIVTDAQPSATGKIQYITIRSPTSNGIATVSIEYLKRRWNGFHEEDLKDMLQKELVAGKAFILADSKKNLDEAAYKKWKAQNEKVKADRKRRKSSSAVLSAA